MHGLALISAIVLAAVSAKAEPQASKVPSGFIGISVPPIVSSVVGENLPTVAPSLYASYYSANPGATASEASNVLCYFQSRTTDVAALSVLSRVGVYTQHCGDAAQTTATTTSSTGSHSSSASSSASTSSSTSTITSTTASTITSSGTTSISSGTTTRTSVSAVTTSSPTSNPAAVQTPLAVGGALVAGLLGVIVYL